MNVINNIKFSIIIPVYNSEVYLERCIKSVINKNYEYQYEVLLIDDGSTDSSAQICKKYVEKNKCIKYFYKENGGPSSARNFGIQKSKGEFIVFIDSDDYVDDNFYEKIFDVISTEYDFYIFNYKFKSNVAEYVEKISLPCGKINDLKVLYESVVQMRYNAPWAKIFKNSIIKQYGLQFDEHLTVAEDLDFYMQFASRMSTAYVVCENWYVHVSNGSGLCAQGKLTYINDFDYVYAKVCKFVEMMNLSSDIMHEVKKVFLKNCFSVIGANLKEAKKINFYDFFVYSEILSEKYEGFKLNFEKNCLKYKLYILMKIFSWYINIKKKLNY